MEKRNLGGAVVCNTCGQPVTDNARLFVVRTHGLYLDDNLEEWRHCAYCANLGVIPKDRELSCMYNPVPQ